MRTLDYRLQTLGNWDYNLFHQTNKRSTCTITRIRSRNEEKRKRPNDVMLLKESDVWSLVSECLESNVWRLKSSV